jgi:hypothetical protein
VNTDLLAAVITAVVGLLVMESYQTTPWLADRLMRWSVRVRYTDNRERATVREEELIGLLEDLPTLFKLPVAGGFFFRALAYRLASLCGHVRREPRVARRSLGARFRIALVKSCLVIICTGAVFGIETVVLVANSPSNYDKTASFLWWGLIAGTLAVIESVLRPSRYYPGFIGGLTIMFFSLPILLVEIFGQPLFENIIVTLFFQLLCAAVFGLATAGTYTLVGKTKYVGAIVGVVANLTGIALAILMELENSPGSTLNRVEISVMIGGYSLAIGALAGFTVVVERRVQQKMIGHGSSAVSRDSKIQMIDSVPIILLRSSPDAVRPPSISLDEPPDKVG